MPQQRRSRRRWVAVVPAIALVSCAPAPKPASYSTIPMPPLDPPTAVAPPDPGVDTPMIQFGPAGRSAKAQPQEQLSGWADSLADQLNIPRVPLQAYGYAARSMQATMPGCGLSWTVLAGIGQAESHHGRHDGTKLDATGRPSAPIIGPPLDGSAGVKRIPDTDGGALDGDPVWDHAIGPLQFLPTTWKQWGVDGDGDGVADPQDINDAALSAARYLCTVGGELRKPDRFWAALLTYNESHAYGQEVLNYADYYGKTSKGLPIKG